MSAVQGLPDRTNSRLKPSASSSRSRPMIVHRDRVSNITNEHAWRLSQPPMRCSGCSSFSIRWAARSWQQNGLKTTRYCGGPMSGLGRKRTPAA